VARDVFDLMEEGAAPRRERDGRAPTTIAATILILVVTAPFLWSGIRSLQLAAGSAEGGGELNRSMVLLGVNPGSTETTTLAVFGAAVTLTLSALALVLALGVFRRREGAHHAAIGVFGAMGAVALLTSLQGVLADPPAPNARFGVMAGLANVAIVVLLIQRSTATDFERAESARSMKKRAKMDRRRQAG
jgi:hypothetical protein